MHSAESASPALRRDAPRHRISRKGSRDDKRVVRYWNRKREPLFRPLQRRQTYSPPSFEGEVCTAGCVTGEVKADESCAVTNPNLSDPIA